MIQKKKKKREGSLGTGEGEGIGSSNMWRDLEGSKECRGVG